MSLHMYLDYCLLIVRFVVHNLTHFVGLIKYFLTIEFGSKWKSNTTAMDIATRYHSKVDGSVTIVTGSTGGIGLETVLALAANGGQVIMTYRSEEKRERSMKIITDRGLQDKVIPLQLELADYASIRRFVADFKQLNLPLNCLINNAGVALIPTRTLTQHGHETMLGVNHFGHFYLTELLIPILEATAKKTGRKARIVNVSSGAHLFSPREGIVFDNLSLKGRYSPLVAYGHSKLANILHTLALNSKFVENRQPIVANSAHPGFIPETELGRHTADLQLTSSMWPLGKTMSQGAATSLYLALDDAFEDGLGGLYASDCHIVRPVVGHAYNVGLAERFYGVSVEEMKRIVKSLD